MAKVSKQALEEARQIADALNRIASVSGSRGLDGKRLDADETQMLALSLEQMRATVYETQYAPLKGRTLFPIDSDIDEGADSFSYEESDHVGAFKALSGDGYADDPPSSEASATKITKPIAHYGGGYIWTIQDLRRAAFSGKPLSARKANACRRAWEEKLDQVIAEGDPGSGLATGAVNRAIGTGAGQTRETLITTADWVSATANAANMLADLMQAVREFVVDAGETLTPTDLALPLREYMLAKHTYFTDVAGGTVLDRFLKDNGFVRNVHAWNGLAGAGAGSSGSGESRGLLWAAGADNASVVIPMDFKVLPIQQHNFAFKQLAEGRTAGFCVYRPLSLRYITNLPHS